MRLKQFIFFLLGFTFFLPACSIFDQDDYSPAFINITRASLTTAPQQGDAVFSITHAWVYTDGNLIGVFPIPSKVPIIVKDQGKEVEIIILGGVTQDGDLNSSVEYPFFEQFLTKLNLESGKEYTLEYKTRYKKEAVFDFVEDFESNSHIMTKDLDADMETRINFYKNDKSTGTQSGILELSKNNKIGAFTTFNYFDNNTNKKASVFLEFDYKSDEDMFVGFDIETKQQFETLYTAFIPKSDKWRRAYINLTQNISKIDVLKYRIAIKAQYTSSSKDKSILLFDNMKFLHF